MEYDIFTAPQNAPDVPPAWLIGLQRFQNSDFVRPEHEYEVIWSHKKVRCFRVNHANNAPNLLIIPSLINRYYILDLSISDLGDKLSLAKYLANSGINVFLLDWDEPSEEDGELDAAGYVMDYLQPLLEHLSLQTNNMIHVMGYCVGGVLALALAVLQPKMVKSLILIATPWNFAVDNYPNKLWSSHQQIITNSWCNNSPLVSGAYLSWLFYLAAPEQFEEKYKYFNNLSHDSESYHRFLAVENWVNDTVPLTSAFARNCLIDWAEHNITAKGEWLVEGTRITPDKIKCRSLVVAPINDKIVTMANAKSIANQMRDVEVLTPPTGHIGMIIGGERHKNLWQPMVEWINAHS